MGGQKLSAWKQGGGMFSKIDNSFGKWFCWLNDQWIKQFINDDKDIIVKLINSIKSECSYCTNVRVFMIGAAVFAPLWLGLLFTFLVLLFAWGERRYMCLKTNKDGGS
jgi:hypothetical protein